MKTVDIEQSKNILELLTDAIYVYERVNNEPKVKMNKIVESLVDKLHDWVVGEV